MKELYLSILRVAAARRYDVVSLTSDATLKEIVLTDMQHEDGKERHGEKTVTIKLYADPKKCTFHFSSDYENGRTEINYIYKCEGTKDVVQMLGYFFNRIKEADIDVDAIKQPYMSTRHLVSHDRRRLTEYVACFSGHLNIDAVHCVHTDAAEKQSNEMQQVDTGAPPVPDVPLQLSEDEVTGSPARIPDHYVKGFGDVPIPDLDLMYTPPPPPPPMPTPSQHVLLREDVAQGAVKRTVAALQQAEERDGDQAADISKFIGELADKGAPVEKKKPTRHNGDFAAVANFIDDMKENSVAAPAECLPHVKHGDDKK